MKMFDFEKYGKMHKIQLNVTAYQDNGNLAITMTAWESGAPEPWSTLTVNLDSICPKDCAFIDTNNNGSDILAWIIRNGLAVPTGIYERSGYCEYPQYRFRSEILKELDPEGYSAYLYQLKQHMARRDTTL